MNRTCMTLLMLLALSASAQDKPKRTIALYGHVKDSFTKVGIPNTKITLMRSDSSVIDTVRVWRNPQPGVSYDATYNFRIPAENQNLIILAQHPDYEDTYINYHVRPARNTFLDAPWHYMKKRQKEPVPLAAKEGNGQTSNASDNFDMEGEALSEVVIKATKVKIAYRGDTLVFNADAFNVPEGSMLDGLIKQLPGVELKSDGQILVNGRKIDNLTLNGKDFFRGKNQIMLNNLPYYTVKEIKVFDASTETSQYLGRDVEQTEYTMDVQLKREYNVGTMANAAVAGGTSDTYMARLFGMRFTDNSRIVLFGNTNNINQNAYTNSQGDWRSYNRPEYRLKRKNIGGQIVMNDKDNRMSNTTSYDITWEDADAQSRTHSVNFLSTGNTFGNNVNNRRSRDFNYDLFDEFMLKVPFRLTSTLRLIGSNGKSTGFSADTTFSDEAQQLVVNSQMSQNRLKNSLLHLSFDNHAVIKLPSGDALMLTLNGSYTNKGNKSFAHSAYDYTLTPQLNSLRNTYDRAPKRDYHYHAQAEYEIHWLNNWNLATYYIYRQQYNEDTDQLYRLDWLSQQWADARLYQLGSLPESRDSLLAALDLDNAYNQNTLERRHQFGVRPFYSKRNDKHYIYADIHLPVRRVDQKLHYHSRPLSASLDRHYYYFFPNASFTYYTDNFRKGFRINFELTKSLPQLDLLIDRYNDANPFAVQTGNPGLRPQTNYLVNGFFNYGMKNRRGFYLNYHANIRHNAIGQGYSYDPTTGVRTYHPINVNGNGDAGLSLQYSTPLDSAGHWFFRETSGYDFIRTRDLASIVGSASDGMTRVNNHRVQQRIWLDYSFKDFTIQSLGEISWRRILRSDVSVGNDDLFEFSYGVVANYTIPVATIQLSTDFSIRSRRGYQEASMNDDEFLWNASVSRSFRQGRLNVRLSAYDLLNQINVISYSVNAQGRTERWTNSFRRYVMLTIDYKFNTMQKKK